MSRLRQYAFACLAGLCLALTSRGATISDAQVTNVGTTTFSVVWVTSEVSTPGLEVFSDGAGTNSVANSLGFEFYPIAEGDPRLINTRQARAGSRALELLASNRRVVTVRVTGASPGSAYHVRPRTFGPDGLDNGAAVHQLLSVETAQFSSMVNDARLLHVRFTGFSPEGMIALLQVPGFAPLSTIVGDSSSEDSTVFRVPNLLDTTTRTNALFSSPQQVNIRLLGAGAPAGSSPHTIDFGSTFAPARITVIDAELTSPAPAIATQPADQSVAEGQTAIFEVAVSGTPNPTVTWQRKPAGLTPWSDLAEGGPFTGVNTRTLSVSQTTVGMTGDQFRAIATNGVPPDATSQAATLTVTQANVAPLFATQPTARTVAIGFSGPLFGVTVTGTPTPAVKWQYRRGSDPFVDVPEAAPYATVTTATLTLQGATLDQSGLQFRAVAGNGTLPDAISDVVSLTVEPATEAPLIATHPLSKTVNDGASVFFDVAATGTPTPAIRWQRKPASSSDWTDISDGGIYSGATNTRLSISQVSVSMYGDQLRAIASNGVPPNATSNAATLTVTTVQKTPATVIIASLQQSYNGNARMVTVTTAPAGLNTVVTYNGSSTAPTLPGSYAVNAQVDDPNYGGSAIATMVIAPTATVRRAPTIAGILDGSIQVLNPESITLGGMISGGLLVPGMPAVTGTGTVTAGPLEGPGAATPTTHQVTLNSTSFLGHLVRRVDASTMPIVPVPPQPTGTRNVSLTSAGQSAGDWSTVRILSVSGTAGSVAVPPGTYGSLMVNGNNCALVLGVEGSTEPAVYNLQVLSVNPLRASAKLRLVGPVIINVTNTVNIMGDAGNPDHFDWLSLRVSSGGVTINGPVRVYGHLTAPSGLISVAGASKLQGRITSDRLSIATTAELEQP